MSDLDGAPPEFFQSRSLAVQLAAMLSQFVTGCVPRNAARMGFIYNANTERSGKTLLCKLAIIPVNGKMPVQTWTKREEDLRKAADAEMLGGARAIVYDNVRGHIQSQVVEALMTSATWTGRVLGRTEMFEATNNATVFLTGNDCTVSPDMAHRCLICDLFLEEADVQEHQVKDPISDVWLKRPENRFKILSALWGIVRYWNDAGRPKPSGRLRVGFEEWCNVVAGIVEFAGFGDCLAQPEVEKDVNTEATDVRLLVQELIKQGEPEARRLEYSFQEITDTAYALGVCGWVLEGKEIEGHYILTRRSQIKFGKLVRKYAPLKPDSRRFTVGASKVVRIHCTSKNQNRRYIIEKVTP